jgi:hypothetical protein
MNLKPFRKEELLEDGDEGCRRQHVLPHHDPVPHVQPLAKRIDHLKQKKNVFGLKVLGKGKYFSLENSLSFFYP